MLGYFNALTPEIGRLQRRILRPTSWIIKSSIANHNNTGERLGHSTWSYETEAWAKTWWPQSGAWIALFMPESFVSWIYIYIYKHTLDPRKKIQMWITIGPEILSNGTDVWAKTKHTSGGVNRSQFAERLGYFSRTGLFQSPTGKHVRLVFGGISTKLCSTRVVSRHVCWMFILFLLSLSLSHTHFLRSIRDLYIYRDHDVIYRCTQLVFEMKKSSTGCHGKSC